jgi:2-phosphoglycerate kinase
MCFRRAAMGRVYLLGGTSRAGKTSCADQIAGQFGLEKCSVDAVRQSLQASAPADDPINYFSNCAWLDLSTKNSLDRKNDVAQRTCRLGVAPLMEGLLVANRGVIVEGDDLLPEFVEQWVSLGATAAVFLVYTDHEEIRRRYWDGDATACIHRDRERLERFIPHYLGWERWLQSDAAGRNLTVVDAKNGSATSNVATALGLSRAY